MIFIKVKKSELTQNMIDGSTFTNPFDLRESVDGLFVIVELSDQHTVHTDFYQATTTVVFYDKAGIKVLIKDDANWQD